MNRTTSDTVAPPMRWAIHPSSRKWHAYHEGVEQSVCGYTAIKLEPRDAPPFDATVCRACLSALNLSEAPTEAPTVTRPRSEHDRREEHLVEFIGGRFDGMRLELHVVRDAPGAIRVLGQSYHERGGR